ncbi:MAG TPA: calcium-binding protein, partial [Allosphingosinicella sp.]|nr:calcium-binding protein [Allosphingosinicella sp.]
MANINGTPESDNLSGTAEGDFIIAGAGNDAVFGGAGNDEIHGEDGDDTLFGQAGDDQLYGESGNDLLRGDGGNDELFGGDGNDNLRGGAGIDSFDGGSNTEEDNQLSTYGDRISFYEGGATQGVVADLRTGIISNDGFGNVENMVGIESLGSDTAFVDTFYGNDGRNAFLANKGDYLYGFGGDDDFYITSAAALVDGGDGVDRLDLGSSGGWLMPDSDGNGFAEVAAAATSGWIVDLSTGYVEDGYGNVGSVAGIENVGGSGLGDTLVGDDNANTLSGGTGDDVLIGLGGDDLLEGGSGHDYLEGNAGNDSLQGGDDDDYLYGNAGDDLLNGGNGFDRVGYSAGATTGVTVDLNIVGVAQDTGSQGWDTLIGVEHVSGTRFNDVLTGDGGDNWLWGGSNGSGITGDDIISAGAGNDLVDVGNGNHQLDGGSGIDTLGLDGNGTDITVAGVTVSLALQGAGQDTE